jgi:hypothetical protein
MTILEKMDNSLSIVDSIHADSASIEAYSVYIGRIDLLLDNGGMDEESDKIDRISVYDKKYNPNIACSLFDTSQNSRIIISPPVPMDVCGLQECPKFGDKDKYKHWYLLVTIYKPQSECVQYFDDSNSWHKHIVIYTDDLSVNTSTATVVHMLDVNYLKVIKDCVCRFGTNFIFADSHYLLNYIGSNVFKEYVFDIAYISHIQNHNTFFIRPTHSTKAFIDQWDGTIGHLHNQKGCKILKIDI